MTAYVNHSLVFAPRNVEHIRQIPEKLLDVTLQPIMFVLLFAFVFGGAIHVTGGSYREYLIGGILVQSVAFGLMGPGVSIATDLGEGMVDRIFIVSTRPPTGSNVADERFGFHDAHVRLFRDDQQIVGAVAFDQAVVAPVIR